MILLSFDSNRHSYKSNVMIKIDINIKHFINNVSFSCGIYLFCLMCYYHLCLHDASVSTFRFDTIYWDCVTCNSLMLRCL